MTSSGNLLKPGQQIKPLVDVEIAKHLLAKRYGFRVARIVELDAYDDRNYHVLCLQEPNSENPHEPRPAEAGYVLKIVNSLDSKDTGFVDAQNELLVFLSRREVRCPVPVAQLNGSLYSRELLGPAGRERSHVVRLLRYLPGQLLAKVRPSEPLLREVGSFLAQLDVHMQDFFHPAYESHESLWSLGQLPRIRDFAFALDDEAGGKRLVEEVVRAFEARVLARAGHLERGIIHGDLNANNILVDEAGRRLEAVIDFGDSHKSCLVFELAVCLCYVLILCGEVEAARPVLDGYRSKRRLSPREQRVLGLCVCARLAQTLTISAYSFKNEPGNGYLISEQDVKWRMLRHLWALGDANLARVWGLEAATGQEEEDL